MATLTLPLKKKWFDLIKAGIKKEEYRDGSKSFYWANRLREHTPTKNGVRYGSFKHFDSLVFTLGYPKAGNTERRLEFKNPKIRIGTGKPEWGADPNKLYFVITWENQ